MGRGGGGGGGHIHRYSVESRREMRTLGIDTVKRCLDGKLLRNVVNAKFLKNSRSPIMEE